MSTENVIGEEIINPSPRLYNEDLAPAKERKWGVFSLFAMWMSDVHSIGGYTFAAGLFFLGLGAWQVFLAEIIGIMIVLYLANLSGKIGYRHGVPYPVVARVGFGVFGSNIPALLRGFLAVFWYGIQTYLASLAITAILVIIFPGMAPLANHSFLGLHYLGWIGFIILWIIQLIIISYGMDIVRRFNDFAGPLVYVLMLALVIWILAKAHWSLDLNLSPIKISASQSVVAFFTAISLVVAYFSAILLNVCDFTRFTPSYSVVKKGNFWGLPVNFTLFSLASVITTAGALAVFGEAITDPVHLVMKIHNTPVLIIAALGFAIATMGINIVANLVSPAYDLANLSPKHITFRRGAIITAILSVIVMPWKIFANPAAVQYFLGGMGAFMAPIFAIMIVDYYMIKNEQINVQALYQLGAANPYWYQNGFNKTAIIALLLGTAITGPIALLPYFHTLAAFSWFIGVGVTGTIYWFMARNEKSSVRKYLETQT